MFSPRASAVKPGPRDVLIQRFVAGVMQRLPVMSLVDWVPNASMRQFRDAFKFVETESMKILQAKKGEVEKDGLESVTGSKDLIALLRAFPLILFLAAALTLFVALQSSRCRTRARRACRTRSSAGSSPCAAIVPVPLFSSI